MTWYRINDLPSTQEVIGDANNHHLGVFYKNGQPKPALRALTYFQSLFAGGFQCIDRHVRVTKPLRSDAEVHVFERPDGSAVVTAWLRTVVPGERGDVSEGQALDQRHEWLDLEFPFEAERTTTRFDVFGKPQGAWPVRSRRGQSRIAGLCLRGGNVTVLVLEPLNKRQ